MGLLQFLRNLPSSRKRPPLPEANKNLKRCYRVMAAYMERICELVYPGDLLNYHKQSFEYFSCSSTTDPTEKMQIIVSGIKATKRGTLERNILRGYLCVTECVNRIKTIIVQCTK